MRAVVAAGVVALLRQLSAAWVKGWRHLWAGAVLVGGVALWLAVSPMLWTVGEDLSADPQALRGLFFFAGLVWVLTRWARFVRRGRWAGHVARVDRSRLVLPPGGRRCLAM